MKTLDNGATGKIYVIKDITGEIDQVKQRFLELGLTTGQRVKIIARSTLKKVCLLQIRGYLLSVRSSLLNCVVIK